LWEIPVFTLFQKKGVEKKLAQMRQTGKTGKVAPLPHVGPGSGLQPRPVRPIGPKPMPAQDKKPGLLSKTKGLFGKKVTLGKSKPPLQQQNLNKGNNLFKK
jgi:hypothetical protein